MIIPNNRPTKKQIKTLISSGWDIAFHGSGSDIEKFSDDKVGIGADGNSSPGLFLTYLPYSAAEYSEFDIHYEMTDKSFVYIVCFQNNKTYQALNREDFYGIDEFGNQLYGKDYFRKKRCELIAQGFDTLSFDDGEDSMVVVLKPSSAMILAKIPRDQFSPEDFDGLDALGISHFLGNERKSKKVCASESFNPLP